MKPASGSQEFFKNLPVLQSYADVTKPQQFRPAPPDWHVIITDVVNSTGAIEAGRYKNVYVLGATTIIGLLNIAGPVEFPFVFGGDGASFLVPPVLLAPAKKVLIAARNRAQEVFDLELRVGVVPVSKVIEEGYSINVAKLRMSDHFVQAVFAGGGISRAEQLIKKPPPGERYELPPDPTITDADFSGLECRWNPVRSDRGEAISVLIQATCRDEHAKNAVYRDVIAKMETLFGMQDARHPITQPNLRLTSKRSELLAELRSKRGQRRRWIEWCHLSWILFQNRVGNVLLGKRFRFAGVDWGNYKSVLIRNTDCQKFDDMIRMVICCSPESRTEFERYLCAQHAEGNLSFGMHVTDHALLTCLVFDRFERHCHFVDGSNGGYALAAKALKRQIKSAGYI